MDSVSVRHKRFATERRIMRKQLCKTTAVCFCAAGMVFGRGSLAWGAWQTDGTRWQYCTEEGKEPLRSVWRQIDGEWYRFDEKGVMKTGWYLDTGGRWYFLNPVSDGTKGRMMTGWQWIDGFCYYLGEQADKSHPWGAMYADEETPDHYRVNKSGAWTDESGNPVYHSGRGIQTKDPAGISGEKRETRVKKSGGGSSGRETGTGGRGKTETGTGRGTEADKSEGTEEEGNGGGSGGTEAGENGGGSEGTEAGGNGGGGEGRGAGESNVGTGGTETGDKAAREQVNWQIRFADSETHQTHLMPPRSGTIEDGGSLTIYFQTQITDSQGYIWKSKQQSPYIVTIESPQNRIVYVEYIKTGETGQESDAWQEERKLLEEWLSMAREEEGAFRGINPEEIPDSAFLVTDRDSCGLRLKSAASRLLPGQEAAFYVIGKNHIPEGTVLAETFGEEVVYSHTTEQQVPLEDDLYTIVRFQILKVLQEETEDPVWTGEEKRHWNLGDIQERTMDGVTYRFRCIDQNYGDETDRDRQKALFLCDTVIPADVGSEYLYDKKEDGTYGYRFCPGPVVSFGDTGSYKYSRIRRWLTDCREDFGETEMIPVGQEYAYEGSTVEGSFSQLEALGLRPVYTGKQSMSDHIFLLSVDEALRYRQWLWRFEGSEEENPESQWGTFCESYWLRTPAQEKTEEGGDMAYVVDLVRGNIRPHPISIKENPEDPELGATGTVGVRPVFAVRQY